MTGKYNKLDERYVYLAKQYIDIFYEILLNAPLNYVIRQVLIAEEIKETTSILTLRCTFI